MMPGHFLGQHDKEEVIVVTRQHWIALLGRTIEVSILFIILPLIYGIVLFAYPDFFIPPYNYLLFAVAVIYGYAVWAFAFLSWAQYWFDIAIITSERIVKIDQKSMFSREISEFRISRVQDVRVEINGMPATLLKFGDVYVETAGEGPAFVFRAIPNPERIKDIILYHQGRMPVYPAPAATNEPKNGEQGI